jgi:hypothetical protein
MKTVVPTITTPIARPQIQSNRTISVAQQKRYSSTTSTASTTALGTLTTAPMPRIPMPTSEIPSKQLAETPQHYTPWDIMLSLLHQEGCLTTEEYRKAQTYQIEVKIYHQHFIDCLDSAMQQANHLSIAKSDFCGLFFPNKDKSYNILPILVHMDSRWVTLCPGQSLMIWLIKFK